MLIVDIPWSQETKISCLAIYAPNQPDQNKDFWEDIGNHMKKEKQKNLTCMLGDFNLVEDSADRLPPHSNPLNPVDSLIHLKTSQHLTDGCRREHPREIDFFYRSESSSTQSRINHIYIHEKLIKHTYDWKIERTGLNTDHLLVHMSLINPWLLHQGTGRYVMPAFLLDHEKLMGKLSKIGRAHHNLIQQIGMNRMKDNNPQILHQRLKKEMIKEIRTYAKCMTSILD